MFIIKLFNWKIFQSAKRITMIEQLNRLLKFWIFYTTSTTIDIWTKMSVHVTVNEIATRLNIRPNMLRILRKLLAKST